MKANRSELATSDLSKTSVTKVNRHIHKRDKSKAKLEEAAARARELAGSPTTHKGYPHLILSSSEMLVKAKDETERSVRVEGTFAGRDFKKGEKIRVLGGETYSRIKIHKLIERGKIHNDDPLQIGRRKYVVLGEDSRKINHSCEPNAGINGKQKLIAIRDIKKGEEITFDYSTTAHPDITPKIWTMECNCGVEACRGKVQNVSTIPPEILAKYLKASAIPDYLIPIAEKIVNS